MWSYDFDGENVYRSSSQYSHAGGVGGAARGARVARPRARRRRPAPPSYPPAPRQSARARAELDEEIFALSASARSPWQAKGRRGSRVVALVVPVLAVVAVALWWWA